MWRENAQGLTVHRVQRVTRNKLTESLIVPGWDRFSGRQSASFPQGMSRIHSSATNAAEYTVDRQSSSSPE